MLMNLYWPHQNSLLYAELKFKQVSSGSGIMEITMEITIFYCVKVFQLTLPKILMDLDF